MKTTPPVMKTAKLEDLPRIPAPACRSRPGDHVIDASLAKRRPDVVHSGAAQELDVSHLELLAHLLDAGCPDPEQQSVREPAA
jgi:hypothetical protein